ncbi:MAG TPA: hypothetical protein VFJ16_01320 [Longimicrobium sp.]|nr:hypothetical protein [Longimicrobium sp.]
MKKTTFALAALAAVAFSGTASAQVCAGFPTRDGQGSLHALANFPSGFDQYGGEVSYNLAGPLAVNGGFIYSTADGEHLNTFRAGAALDISSYTGGMLPGISICPNVRADFSSQDDVDLVQVPIGLGLGATLPLGDRELTLTPYAIPALYWTRISGGGDSVSETDFGIRGGADVNFDRFFLGGMVEWVNVEGQDAVFGVRAGIKF